MDDDRTRRRINRTEHEEIRLDVADRKIRGLTEILVIKY